MMVQGFEACWVRGQTAPFLLLCLSRSAAGGRYGRPDDLREAGATHRYLAGAVAKNCHFHVRAIVFLS